ncbi:hypothetical protein ACOBQB_09750, partial [Streptomyces sp. G5(2025)]
MDDELTNDDHLRALAALEAVVQNNDGALAVLASNAREPTGGPAGCVREAHRLDRVLLAAFGIEATMTRDETSQ